MLVRNIKTDTLKCKDCNVEKSIEEFNRYKEKGEEAIRCKCKPCYFLHIKKYKNYKREHYLKNKQKYNEKSKLYRENHKQELVDYFKKRRTEKKDIISKNRKEYYQKNKKIINSKRLEEIKKDPKKRILKSLRNRIIKVLKNNSKSSSTVNLLGCTIQEFKEHLEKQFYDDICWENYGKRWHIDHIIPCSAFNLVDEIEQRKCFHYLNMRPLLAIENLKKGKKMPEII